jgi:DNA adenine methylase
MQVLSPLRYPGGKARVSGFVKNLINCNALLGGNYVEPYVGGGAVALSLLFGDYVKNIYINDKDRSIYAFWYSVLHYADDLCTMIFETPINMENWLIQKDIQSNKQKSDLLTLGFSTFFLNRTNRSGIIKAGVIGGKNQDGRYKIDARYQKDNLIMRIRKICEYRDRIKLSQKDAVEFVMDLAKIMPENTLYYLDPPYYKKGRDLYMNYYNDHDHLQIKEAVEKAGINKWIISYDDVEEITNMYSNYRQKKFLLSYSASRHTKGKEVMIFSNNMIIPNDKLFEE